MEIIHLVCLFAKTLVRSLVTVYTEELQKLFRFEVVGHQLGISNNTEHEFFWEYL